MKLSSISPITELKAKFTSVWLSAFSSQARPVFSDLLSLVTFRSSFPADISCLTVLLHFHIFISSLYFQSLVQASYREALHALSCLFFLD